MEKRIKILLKTIELLKVELDELINETEELLKPEILKKSQEIDKLLLEYYHLLKKIKEE